MPNLARLLSILLIAFSLIPFSGSVLAQDDIDDVFNNLDADFKFGGREEVKQTNLNNTNEQNSEDIKITEQENQQNSQNTTTTTTPTVVMVDVILDLETVTDPVTVEIVGGSTLVSGLMGFSQHNLQFPAGSSQTLKITCNGASCTYHFFFVKGANWVTTAGPTLINPGPTPS